MTAKEINKIIKLEVKHTLYRDNGTWYHHLKEFPSALFDNNGYVIFNSKSEYLQHSSLKHKKTLHVRKGISSFNNYIRFTTQQKALLKFSPQHIGVDETTIREIREISRIKRKQKLVDDIKSLYDFTCQICGERLKVHENVFYSEVHHIKPLGGKHTGPDITENMMSVCPNHHVLLDLGAIEVDVRKLLLKHNIRQEFIDYHNSSIFLKVISNGN
jgi:5-methylcytosine-specific restriction protein A